MKWSSQSIYSYILVHTRTDIVRQWWTSTKGRGQVFTDMVQGSTYCSTPYQGKSWYTAIMLYILPCTSKSLYLLVQVYRILRKIGIERPKKMYLPLHTSTYQFWLGGHDMAFSLESYTPGQVSTKAYKDVYTAYSNAFYQGFPWYGVLRYVLPCMYFLVQCHWQTRGTVYFNCQDQLCTGMYCDVPVYQ
jgi:hypothetical protein